MEEKILQACKLINALGSDYTLKDWHEVCIQVMNMGLTESTLKDFIDQSTNKDTLGDMEKGNYYSAANYIRNFIMWNSNNMIYVKEYSYLLESFINSNNK